MEDVDLQVRLNKRIRLSFVAGEDRTVELLLSDGNTLLPLDLTGAKLTLTLPRAGGYAIKRRTGPLLFGWKQVTNQGGMAVFSVDSHGLATGDTVSLTPAQDGETLPAPFVVGEPYVVIVSDSDDFTLVQVDADGNSQPMALANPLTAQGAANLLSQDFQITNPALGQASCRLTAACTTSCAIGQGQSYQLVYTDRDNLTRIYSGGAMLDVMGQADYLELDGTGNA